MHISYCLPDTEDSYADFRCRDGRYLYRTRYFGETPTRTTAKFGTKKRETLGYFTLADSMALSSAVLELLTSESPIFRFRTFWGHKHPDEFRRWGTNLHHVSRHDNPIIYAQKFTLWFRKIAPFWNGGPIGSRVNKNSSKFCGF